MDMHRPVRAAGRAAAVAATIVVALGCGAGALEETSGRRFDRPPEVGDGWLTATPEDVGLHVTPLRDLAEMLDRESRLNVHAILVVKNGQLVYEQYFSGTDQARGTDLGQVTFDRETLHDLRSVSKSVTSAVVGIAQDDGLIPGVETVLFELFPSHDLPPDRAQITLRDMLTMSAGFEWDETLPYTDPRNSEIQMGNSPDPIRYVLEQQVVETPGTTFNYNGGLTTLLGGLVERGSGESLADYAQRTLFEPLGIEKFEWRRDRNGLHSAASGLRLIPRDLAKFGFLYLNGGEWQGTQVLPGEWVEASTRPHIEVGGTMGYGYQWFIRRYASGEQVVEVFAAIGNGGQRVYVVPQHELLVVIHSGGYDSSDPSLRFLGERLMGEYLLPAAGSTDAEFMAPDL